MLAPSATSVHGRRGCGPPRNYVLDEPCERPSAATSSSAISPPDRTAFSTAAEVRSSSRSRRDSVPESLGGMVENHRPVRGRTSAAKGRAEMDSIEAGLGQRWQGDADRTLCGIEAVPERHVPLNGPRLAPRPIERRESYVQLDELRGRHHSQHVATGPGWRGGLAEAKGHVDFLNGPSHSTFHPADDADIAWTGGRARPGRPRRPLEGSGAVADSRPSVVDRRWSATARRGRASARLGPRNLQRSPSAISNGVPDSANDATWIPRCPATSLMYNAFAAIPAPP